MWMYVGTYTSTTSRGIYGVELDETTGKFSEPKLMVETPNPSFLALRGDGKFLYAACDPNTADQQRRGGVAAFKVDPNTRLLTLINVQPCGDGGNCHVGLSPDGKFVGTADYGAAIANLLPTRADGGLDASTAKVQHTGSGPNKERQEAAHAHCTTFDPSGTFLLVCDLGTDQTIVYRVEREKGTLTGHSIAVASTPGAGPRHVDFSKDKRFVYAINELNNSIDTFRWDAGTGTLKFVQNVPLLPPDFKLFSKASEVCVHPSGAFVYGANRGHDSIVHFHVDRDDGHLSLAGHMPCGGKSPRHFGIDPSGKFLVCGHEESDTIAAFSIDPQTGDLKPTGGVAKIAKPVCVVFA